MHNPTPTEVLDVVGRLEAEQEIPDAMRADVRLLGRLLGHVLVESGSEGLFEDVERLRAATIEAYTSPSSDAFDRAVQIVDSFDLQRADEVARAFTVYFHLVNLAEERQRVRVLRARAGVASRDSRGTVAGAYAALVDEIGPEDAKERLDGLVFHPVFTAHPTEARRRAISTSIRRLTILVDELAAGPRGGAAERRTQRHML